MTSAPPEMTDPVFEITKSALFDAAHYLPTAESSGYRRLHGHSFQVEATVRGVIAGEVGWVADLGQLDAALKREAGALDHGCLNETPGLESPTLEHLCLHFAGRLQAEFPGLSRIVVSRPTVGERCALELSAPR